MAQSHELFGIRFDCLRMGEAVAKILAWCRADDSFSCRFVVTPNVDHVVLFQEREALRAAYADAAIVLVDGMPIVWASRLLRRRLPERVAGSDLVPALFEEVSSGEAPPPAGLAAAPASSTPRDLKVFLLGALPGIADAAAQRVHETWRGVSVVGTYSPPLGFEDDADENRRILKAVAAAEPDLLIVGLGAPKQELWTHRHRTELRTKVVLCAGAPIDFLGGARSRSPRWMRKVGMEWLHRLLSEPRRLARRYARDAWVFPGLVWREWRSAGRLAVECSPARERLGGQC